MTEYTFDDLAVVMGTYNEEQAIGSVLADIAGIDRRARRSRLRGRLQRPDTGDRPRPRCDRVEQTRCPA